MCADKMKNIIKRPSKMGLYDPQFERDSCGVGLVANIKGIPSREIMEDAYIINSRMDHVMVLNNFMRKIINSHIIF